MQAPIVACAALLAAALGFSPGQGTRLVEPPQEFFLQGKGKDFDLRLGQAFVLPKELAGEKVTLRVRPTRLFEYQGLRFRYPQSYVWQYEQKEDGSSSVTLSGHTNVLTLHVHETALDAAALAKSTAAAVAEQWGAKSKKSEVDLLGKGKSNSLLGWRVQCVIGGSELVQEFYGVKLGEQSGLLMLQDTLTEEGESDPETQALKELWKESLELAR